MFRNQSPRCPRDGAALSILERDPLIGAAFADRYVIEECIGEGGMGRVYRARHQRMSRKFAIKVLYGDHAADPKMRERFVREAEAACRLSHPNVISVLDFGETATEQLYLVMDHVDGRSLAEVIAEEAPFAAQRVRSLLRQLCLGLAHAHDQALVHRDFKGDNVIITGSGSDELARIVDFGLAVILEVPDQRLTTEGLVLGTPAFMSPEQTVGEELDLRSDLFSLGLVVYEMLAGVLPFQGNPIAIARQNLACDPPPIQERVPGLVVDGYLEQIARKLLEKKPADRYQSAREVIAALDQARVIEANATEPMKRSAGTRTPPVARDLAFEATEAIEVAQGTEAAQGAEVARGTEVAQAAQAVQAVQDSRVAATQAGTTMATRGSFSRQRRLLVAALLLVLIGATALVVQRLSAGRQDSAQARIEPQASAEPQDRAEPPADSTAQTAESGTARSDTLDAGSDHQRASDEHEHPGDVGDDAQTAEPDRGSTRTRSPRTRDTRKSSSSAADSQPITNATLSELYQSVGQDLNRLIDKRGAVAAEQFRATYSSVPFHDALRTPSLRRDAFDTLRSLQRKIRRKLKD